MNLKAVYPLKQVLEVKQRRVEDAEKVVKEKQEILQKEKEKLEQREKEKAVVQTHHNDKLKQLRAEMDQGTTSDVILQMRAYLKVVKERLAAEDKKVEDQKAQVKTAENNVQIAKQELARKRQEVDKLLTHEKDWIKEIRKEMEIMEGREMDELGTVIFLGNMRKRESL